MVGTIQYQRSYFKNGLIAILFDLSLLLYFCSFIVFNNDEIDVTGVDSVIRNGATLLVLFFGGLLFIRNKKKIYISKNIYFIGYIIFALFCFSSILWAHDADSVFAVYPPCIRIIILTLFMSVRINTLQDIHVYFVLFIISTLLLCIIVGVMMITFYSTDFINYRFGGNFYFNPNFIALLCCISIGFLLYLLSISNKAFTVIDIILIVFFIVIIALTQSKKGIVGAVLIPFFYEIKSKKSFVNFLFIGLVVTIIVLMAVPEEIFLDIKDSILLRFESFLGQGGKDSSTELREGYTKVAIRMWQQSPVFGVGINNFAILNPMMKGTYSHNNYAELLAGVGVIGFLLYYMPLFCLVFQKGKSNVARILKVVVCVMLILEVGNVTYQTFTIQSVYAVFAICLYKRIHMPSHN